MDMKRLTVLLMCVVAGPVLAGAKFTGSTGYQIVRDSTQVSLTADYIENTSKENATGTLMMKLWATDAPYKSGTLSGHLVGSWKLKGLGPGQRYTAPKQIVTFNPPPARREYFMVLALVEYSNKTGGYVIADYRNMEHKALLGPVNPFDMQGPWRWQFSKEGGTIDIEVAKISHHHLGKTGSLKLSVWATKEPYKGGGIRGYELGSVVKDGLQPGYSYTNVKNVAKYTAPPAGDYYVYVVLSEFGNNKVYSIVDSLGSGKRTHFGPP